MKNAKVNHVVSIIFLFVLFFPSSVFALTFNSNEDLGSYCTSGTGTESDPYFCGPISLTDESLIFRQLTEYFIVSDVQITGGSNNYAIVFDGTQNINLQKVEIKNATYGIYIYNNSDNLSLEMVDVNGIERAHGIKIVNSNDIIIDRANIKGQKKRGIIIESSSGVTVSRSTISGGAEYSPTNGECLEAVSSVDISFVGNLIKDCSEDSIELVLVQRGNIRNNIIIDSKGQGIDIYNCPNGKISISGNHISNSQADGLRIYDSTEIKVNNNNFVDNAPTNIRIQHYISHRIIPDKISIINNLISGSTFLEIVNEFGEIENYNNTKW